ncbi:unnamed protein product [Spirodela intermedia]|uniref:Remorin C-terminal domain-containing protein n=1 Tax=Spirodela intermedia TaxID=51605 RepID=A0A7I8JTC2_SPIIN|nr:unnamed protein product [Spirodela intermedia]CAA6673418.1 unnamed protein product [Spirodela intermedia]
MDFERMQRPNIQEDASGGVSPSKLRRVLLGVEVGGMKREITTPGASSSETFKDVDMLFSLPDFSTVTADTAYYYQRSQALNLGNVRAPGSHEGDFHGPDNASAFEFQRVERAQHRSSMPLFSKSAPSKWDDAQKWIASPTSNRSTKVTGSQLRKTGGGTMGHGSRLFAAKLLEFSEEADSKATDSGQFKKELSMQRTMDWTPDLFPAADPYSKASIILENPFADSAVGQSQQDSSSFIQSSAPFTALPSTVRSVSMRDTGTEMTPTASQEPSRTGTPARDATPIRGPTLSRPSSPGRTAPCSSPINPIDPLENSKNKELSDNELQMKTRREIMALGTQLGKPNIAAWASREADDRSTSDGIKSVAVEQSVQSIIEIRAAAWEEAEKAKYLARFKREEFQIQAWEDHQKAKVEAETRKVEVKVERLRASAHERLMTRLAAARHEAEERRAAAEARRNRRASRTARQVEYIRRTGRVPSAAAAVFSRCWGRSP